MTFKDHNHFHMYIRKALLNKQVPFTSKLKYMCDMAYAFDLEDKLLERIKTVSSKRDLDELYRWVDTTTNKTNKEC